MFKSLIYCLCFISIQVFSQIEPSHVKFKWEAETDTRYINNDSGKRERVQDLIRLGFTVDFNGKFELVAVASSGSQYDSAWETTKNLKDGNSSFKTPQLLFRQLYLQKTSDKAQIQVGSIPMQRSLTTMTGIDKSGWGDGIRAERFFEKGLVGVVVGSIDDLENPDAFTRKRSLNFFEIEVTRELFKNLTGEFLVQHLQGDTYVHGELIYELQNAGEKVITFMSEYIHDLDTAGGVFGSSAETDLLKTLFHKYDGRLKVSAGYLYVGPNMGVYTKLSDDFFVQGGQLQFALKGDITKGGRVTWFSKAYIGEKSKVQAGFNIKLGSPKKPANSFY